MNKDYIRVQSSKNITVTGGLQYTDFSNPDAHIPDRLRVGPLWQKSTCDISEGTGVYPAYIKEWNTVKALVKAGVLTISEIVDDNDITEEIQEKARKLSLNIKEIEKKETKPVIELVDIATF